MYARWKTAKMQFYAIFYVAITPFLNIKMEKGYLYPKKGEHAQATERFVQKLFLKIFHALLKLMM